MFKCCICGNMFEGWGNNPWPIVNNQYARCCDFCNENAVLPARLQRISECKNGTEQGK